MHQFLVNEIPSAKGKYKVLGSGSSNGIDASYFSIDAIDESKRSLRNKFNIPFDSFVWLYVGRIVRDKGINELVNAFLKMSPNHTLLLVGIFEDDQDPVSEETINLIKSSCNILTFGFQNDVRPFFKLSDALCKYPLFRTGLDSNFRSTYT